VRKYLVAVLVAALAITACGPAQVDPDPSATEETVTAPCEDVDTPPTAEEENNVQTIVPTTYCDGTISVTEDGEVECAESVNSFEITVDSTVKGFEGEEIQTKYYPDPDNVYGFTRINWSGPVKAHVIIVDGSKWAFVDNPDAGGQGNTELVASLLNRTDWGAVTADTRVEACGWMKV